MEKRKERQTWGGRRGWGGGRNIPGREGQVGKNEKRRINVYTGQTFQTRLRELHFKRQNTHFN